MTVTLTTPIRRFAYAALAAGLLAAAVLTAAHDGAWWPLAVFALAPDLPLLLGGAGPELAKGQLHARAVPAYNLAHRFWGPAALGAAAALGFLPAGLVVGALAWAFHVALDRAVGYGLRTRDGFQRA